MRFFNQTRKPFGFTLIELLIVVAIIAILAAIAVPNFLEAQTRAKVSRAKSDLRTLSLGINSYGIDTNHFPLIRILKPGQWGQTAVTALPGLTTPVAYLTSVSLQDPFQPKGDEEKNVMRGNTNQSYGYISYEKMPADVDPNQYSNWTEACASIWPGPVENYTSRSCCLQSYGPDRTGDNSEWAYFFVKTGDMESAYNTIYDPTNGTVSYGDIALFTGEFNFNTWK